MTVETHVSNLSSTVGFIDLEEVDSEHLTYVSPQLLQDLLDAAQALGSPNWSEAKVVLVHSEDVSNPAIALTTEHSEPTAVMLAARDPDDDSEGDA